MKKIELYDKITILEREVTLLRKRTRMIIRLRSEYGGLGDHLQFSTLPELFTKAGHDVYLHNGVVCRNHEVKELIYNKNHFILGENAGDWNAGDCPEIKYKNTHEDFIKNWEHANGLTATNSFPKIYYKPETVENIEGLIELSSISLKYGSNEVATIVKDIIAQNPNINWKQLTTKMQQNEILIEGIEKVLAENIYQTIDYINSCTHFVSLSSGSHMIAGALRHHNTKFKQTCLLPHYKYDDMMYLKHFILPLVDYIRV